MTTVIVMGCNPGGLAAIRSLGRRGFHIVAMTHNRSDCGTASKYVDEVAWMPHPTEEEAFVQFLVENKQWHGSLILECGDFFTVGLSNNKELLKNYYSLQTLDAPMLNKFIDKRETYRLAAACGIPYPKTFEPQTMDELLALKDEIPFPCIIKPGRSHEFVYHFRAKMWRINDFEDLREKFAAALEAKQPVMIQEVIPGNDDSIVEEYIYVNSKGEISASFFYQKLRQSPPGFGISRAGVSLPYNEEIDTLVRRLVEHVNYRGYAGIEFKCDSRDGQWKLIEVNSRISRNESFPLACGVDFPWLIYKDLVEDEQLTITEYDEHRYWVELVSDIMNAIIRDNKRNVHWRKFFQPYLARNTAFAVWSLDDPVPFFKQLWSLVIRGIDSLGRRLHKIL